jgi:uncharacterized membrane protein
MFTVMVTEEEPGGYLVFSMSRAIKLELVILFVCANPCPNYRVTHKFSDSPIVRSDTHRI